MPAQPDYLAKMAQCEMAARFAPAGVADFWRSAAECYLLLADITQPAGNSVSGRSPEPMPIAPRFPERDISH